MSDDEMKELDALNERERATDVNRGIANVEVDLVTDWDPSDCP